MFWVWAGFGSELFGRPGASVVQPEGHKQFLRGNKNFVTSNLRVKTKKKKIVITKHEQLSCEDQKNKGLHSTDSEMKTKSKKKRSSPHNLRKNDSCPRILG